VTRQFIVYYCDSLYLLCIMESDTLREATAHLLLLDSIPLFLNVLNCLYIASNSPVQ